MNILIENVLLFLFIYFFCFLGAFSKDLLDAFLNKTSYILIVKILLSAFFVSITIYGFSEWILGKVSYRSFAALCYTLGLISFELLTKYNSVRQLAKLIESYREFKRFNDKNK